jgi:hypothetical protein
LVRVFGLDSRRALWESTSAVAEIVEGLEYGIEHVLDVGFHDTSLFIVLRSNVVLDEIGV